MSSVKLMCRRKASTQARPCCTWWPQPQRADKLPLLRTMNFRQIPPFLVGGSTVIASFLLPLLSQHHLGCTKLTSKLDITAAWSLTFTTSPFYHWGNYCAVTPVTYSQRTTPGGTLTSASAAAAGSFLFKRLKSSSTTIQVDKADATITFRPSSSSGL